MTEAAERYRLARQLFTATGYTVTEHVIVDTPEPFVSLSIRAKLKTSLDTIVTAAHMAALAWKVAGYMTLLRYQRYEGAVIEVVVHIDVSEFEAAGLWETGVAV